MHHIVQMGVGAYLAMMLELDAEDREEAEYQRWLAEPSPVFLDWLYD